MHEEERSDKGRFRGLAIPIGAAVLIGICLVQGFILSKSRSDSLRAKADLASAETELARAKSDLESYEDLLARVDKTEVATKEALLERLDETEADLKKAEEQIEELKQAAGATVSSPDASEPPAALQELMKQFGQGSGAEEADSGEERANPMSALAKMYEGEQGEKFAETSAKMQVNMMYGDFLREAGLDPETRDALRNVLNAHMKAQVLSGVRAMGGEGDFEAMAEQGRVSQERMEAAVAELLNPQQEEAWQQYQETIGERMFRQQMGQSMQMIAPGLTEENREIAMNTLYEEVQGQLGDSLTPNPEEVGPNMERMMGALERTKERMALILEEDQRREFDGFVDHMTSIFEVSSKFMPGGDDTQKTAP